MDLNERFEYSEHSLEDLEQFRDENGFIDLTKAGVTLTDASREYIGRQERIKNWVNFNGTKAIIKGEALFEGEKNYGIYAELIVEEIAKKMGIPAAHYDLVKMLDENGNVVPGVLSVSVVDRDKGEHLESLHAIIGDEPPNSRQQDDTTGFEYTVNKLREVLLAEGYSEETVENLIVDYKKRTAFFLRVADADKHTENVAFIKGIDEQGRPTIRLAPIFDSESALLLDINKSTITELVGNGVGIFNAVDGVYPRIAVCKTEEEGGYGEPWADTLDAIIEDDELYDYVTEIVNQPIDMNEIFESVEKRIGAKLPEDLKEIAGAAFRFRGSSMEEVLDGSYSKGNNLLNSIVDKGKKSVGTTDLFSVFQSLGIQLNLGTTEKSDKNKDDGPRHR